MANEHEPAIREKSGRFKKGVSGNPKGRPKSRPFKEALLKAIQEAGEEGTTLDDIAKKLIEAARNGDMQAIKELNDRLDGKPVTTINLDLETSLSELSPEEAIGTIINYVTNGEISTQEAQQLVSIIESKVKIVEVAELEERLTKLEAKA